MSSQWKHFDGLKADFVAAALGKSPLVIRMEVPLKSPPTFPSRVECQSADHENRASELDQFSSHLL
jgi:hypothetical protein